MNLSLHKWVTVVLALAWPAVTRGEEPALLGIYIGMPFSELQERFPSVDCDVVPAFPTELRCRVEQPDSLATRLQATVDRTWGDRVSYVFVNLGSKHALVMPKLLSRFGKPTKHPRGLRSLEYRWSVKGALIAYSCYLTIKYSFTAGVPDRFVEPCDEGFQITLENAGRKAQEEGRQAAEKAAAAQKEAERLKELQDASGL